MERTLITPLYATLSVSLELMTVCRYEGGIPLVGLPIGLMTIVAGLALSLNAATMCLEFRLSLLI